MPNPVGTWKLIAARFEFSDDRTSVEMYGPTPAGFLVLTEAGRMMVLMTAGDRAPPSDAADRAASFDSMMAYTGNYRLLGEDQFVTTVDAAWHPAWNGTEQARFFTIEGDSLAITTAPQTHPLYPGRIGRGVLTWRRES